MCIRDSRITDLIKAFFPPQVWNRRPGQGYALAGDQGGLYICLLYTSDAADERSSVDLGGRRIIKKKKPREVTENWRIKRTIKAYRNYKYMTQD